MEQDHYPFDPRDRDILEQFYSWKFDEAFDAELQWLEDSHPEGSRSPVQRWTAAQMVKNDLFKQHNQGEKSAVLVALFECLLNDLPVPRWVTMAYLSAIRKVYHFKARTWDDVFGRAHPKGVQVEARRDRRKKSIAVYNRINQIRQEEPERAIEEKLFEQVGREFCICKTLANKYYYAWKRILKNME